MSRDAGNRYATLPPYVPSLLCLAVSKPYGSIVNKTNSSKKKSVGSGLTKAIWAKTPVQWFGVRRLAYSQLAAMRGATLHGPNCDKNTKF